MRVVVFGYQIWGFRTLQALLESEYEVVEIIANNWRTRLPTEIFVLLPYGVLNLHDPLLPEFTGFFPVSGGLASGATEVEITARRVNGNLNTGDAAIQKFVPVGPRATGTERVKATIDLIPEVLLEALVQIEASTVCWRPQDPSRHSFFHKRADRDGLIGWTWSAEDIDPPVRAKSDLYPSANAHRLVYTES